MVETEELWLPTSQAAIFCGCSHKTLKAHRNSTLIEGRDWRYGPSRCSSLVWNVRACAQKLHLKGKAEAEGYKVLRRIQDGGLA